MKNSRTILSKEKLKLAARLLKVIAHPAKLEIIQVLGEGKPMDVTSLCVCIGNECEISMMSHHLAKMKDNGLLKSEKIGKQVFYSLADTSILKLFDCMDQCALV